MTCECSSYLGKGLEGITKDLKLCLDNEKIYRYYCVEIALSVKKSACDFIKIADNIYMTGAKAHSSACCGWDESDPIQR